MCGCRQETKIKPARIVRFNYSFTVTNVPADAGTVTAWAPLPAQHCFQEIRDLEIQSDYPHSVLADPEYSNRVVRFDFSSTPDTNDAERRASISFMAVRSAYDVLAGDSCPVLTPHLSPSHFLEPSTNVPVTGKIAKEAKEVIGNTTEPLAQARKLYNHVVSTVDYDKSGEGWGQGNAVYACNVRKGNCTDFHSLFIAEARSIGLPARFIIGFPLPSGEKGSIGEYHCWAEVHIKGKGWLPVDACEVHENPEKKDDSFGGLGPHRVGFTVGRDLQPPGSAAGPLNFFIYPHVEVNGAKHPGVSSSFSFRETSL
jgi:transglutaminase-like putative cysteine protease